MIILITIIIIVIIIVKLLMCQFNWIWFNFYSYLSLIFLVKPVQPGREKNVGLVLGPRSDIGEHISIKRETKVQ